MVVFIGGEQRYLFADGPRADAIRLAETSIDAYTFIVDTESQGRFLFDLGKANAIQISTTWLTLYY